jgi:hypothetical protein
VKNKNFTGATGKFFKKESSHKNLKEGSKENFMFCLVFNSR